ncbi:MAG: hypothetical protein H0X03_05810, partial [Nitrosopumilus sp.]|nr:hypothetical protein [Nitrosopumilus sp.]
MQILKKKLGKKIIAFFLVFILGMTALQINHFIGTVHAQSDDTWYVGKGVKPDTYYTYEIKRADTNQGQPFLMTIFFKDYNATGKYWNAPTFVVDQGTVYNGTFHLSDLDLTALGSSPIPPEMSKYRGAYASTLDWLSAYVPKPGQSLNSASWGKIGSIGGSEIKPSGTAKVTTPAGTFDTNIIRYYKGVNNNIYVVKDLPYPVKAETYADVTTGKAPIQYAFELKGMGTGEPPVPQTQVEIPKPPLTIKTPRGTYNIQLLWDPVEIKAGQDTKFGIIITDDRDNLVPRATFGVKIMDENNKVLDNLENQHAPDGTG